MEQGEPNASVEIDGRTYRVDARRNLLHVCLSLGLDLPYFCWHPALGSIGACRQCAVKQFQGPADARGRIVMACMTPASDGTRISIEDQGARAFRRVVIEWLMLNHPHDCPICDEGGECHLQDMTLMVGHVARAHRFPKRTHQNQYLGPFVNHEMNRCIQCYRCVRYYRDYAGGRDLDVFASRDRVYFGRHEDGVLESEFSGNLVEVCPTGVFTDKTLKVHYTRKWDLATAPSICVHCGVGCNTTPGERYGTLRRIVNRYNGEVNGYFLCDRGRFGYEFANSELRIRRPSVRRERGAVRERVGPGIALDHLASRLRGRERARIIGIGSPRASLESNFVLRRLVGDEGFYPGLSALEARLVSRVIGILEKGPARVASVREIAESDAVLVLGEDVGNVAPRIALALRQAARSESIAVAREAGIPSWHDRAIRDLGSSRASPVFIASVGPTRIDDLATVARRCAPEDIARLGFSVAHAISSFAPAPSALSRGEIALANRIRDALLAAEKPLVVTGVHQGHPAIVEAAANVASSLSERGRSASITIAVPECNTIGVGMIAGAEPRPLDHAFERVREGSADTVILLENDLFRRAASADVEKFLSAAAVVVVIDAVYSETADRADVVLPSATFAESGGTFVSAEGRAQRFFRVFVPDGAILEAWRWVREIARLIDPDEAEAETLEQIIDEIARAIPAFARIRDAAPRASFRLHGRKIPRQLHRYSGRTAMSAPRSVHEEMPPEDVDSPLAHSMEGSALRPPAPLLSAVWAPGWNSHQAVQAFQCEPGGPLDPEDPGVRLFEPRARATPKYFDRPPDAFSTRPREFLFAPKHDVFGSEELSNLSPAIRERACTPSITMNADDAASVGVSEGESVSVSIAGCAERWPIAIDSSLPRGVVLVPAGAPERVRLEVPGWGSIERQAKG